jgi:hypothetical protein
MDKRDEQCEITIRNCGGVPVLDVMGRLNNNAIATMENVIRSLASAGHYHIVVNVKKAAAANLEMIEKLAEAAQSVVQHYGAIDVVAEAAEVRKLLSLATLTNLFRFCTSENEAFRRIKRLHRSPDATEPDCRAHVMEDK